MSDEHLLEMVGLDGYMCIRYITICFRTGCFLSFWGLVVLVPIFQYRTREEDDRIELNGWDQYTLANIPDDPEAYRLWAPVAFMYLFSLFFCQLLYFEYKNFVRKRVHWLAHGDPDTPQQTYYTVMVERVPTKLRSVVALRDFFEEIFPGEPPTHLLLLLLLLLDTPESAHEICMHLYFYRFRCCYFNY